ncbi:hypothetical protein EYC80_004845 [Monilinia laxa]|uniref:Uncharacterized protein n=1 Tax=Monilinia laxa TaxID=61186 RepID=A0A5N6KIC5_MONLA|nr:hypothetical protein EYC80_004845 [Monilinia laxa]
MPVPGSLLKPFTVVFALDSFHAGILLISIYKRKVSKLPPRSKHVHPLAPPKTWPSASSSKSLPLAYPWGLEHIFP